MERIVLLGGGGHCKVVIDAIRGAGNFRIAGIVERNGRRGTKVLGVPVIGTDRALAGLRKKGFRHCIITVGSIGDPAVRAALAARALKAGFKLATVIHPDARVSRYSTIGDGSYVGAYAVINAGTVVGKNCIINTAAVVEHDCVIGDLVHVAPNATVNGGVTVGARSHIGSGSVILQGLTIGERTIIGCGSVVVKDIGGRSVAFGNPCREERAR